MKKIIQIRGSGGAGKTTVCRQFIQKNNMVGVELPIVGEKGAKSYIMKTIDNQIVVLGRYDKKNGGCDLFNNRKQVFDVISWVIKNIKPKIIIFEGFIYGSFKFSIYANEQAKTQGYNYIGITLSTPTNVALNRIYKRNGGKRINEKCVDDKYKLVISTHKKLVENKCKDYLLDTSNIPETEMYKILEKVVNE
ncbi:MAG: hypothetical protein IKW45_06600 [Clostridia bacterium]|nr:hypothetical protein [Clostridia bacterium]